MQFKIKSVGEEGKGKKGVENNIQLKFRKVYVKKSPSPDQKLQLRFSMLI